MPLLLLAVTGTDETAERVSTPINLKLVLLVIAGAAVVIIGYALVTKKDPLGVGIVAPSVSGTALPDFSNDPLSDGAVGSPIPTVSGTDFVGEPVIIEADGRAKIILFLAHWCSHCRAEVPLVQAWIDGGGLPGGIDFVSVATSISPSRDNYPPDRWLENENWSPPVLADTTNEVGRIFGLSGFPYWVFVDAEGRVAGRRAGGLPIAQLEIVTETLAG